MVKRVNNARKRKKEKNYYNPIKYSVLVVEIVVDKHDK